MKRTIRSVASYICAAVLAVLLFFTASAQSFLYARADNALTFDGTNVLDDLEGGTIAGDNFNLEDYPYSENGRPQLIAFTEYCYSYYASDRDNFGLYAYVYNPGGFAFDSVNNAIQFRAGNDTQPVKYSLALLNYSTEPGTEGLFYKFKVAMTADQRSALLSALDSGARVYELSGIELSRGNTITEYEVGSTYTYSGYAAGYGAFEGGESTLVCDVADFEKYLTLDVEQTVYRPEGDYYNGEQSQLNSCWFTIPNEFIADFGDLSKIMYEWYEYVTKPILVTENAEIWRILDELYGRDTSALAGNYVTFAAFGNTDSAWFGYTSDTAYWNTNVELSGTYHNFFDWSHDVYMTFNSEEEYFDGFSSVFYTGGESYEDCGITADELQEKFLQNSQALGDTSIVGKYSSLLFENYVQEGRTRGYNLAESQDELDIYWNTTTKGSLWQQIFGGYDVDTTWDSVSAFHYVEGSDLNGSDEVVAERLYIDDNDVAVLRERYEAAQAEGETVVLFRYGSTAYYSMPVAQAYSSTADDDALVKEVSRQWSYQDYSAYMVQETVFLNFDIISLTFTNDENVSTTIPAVMSPEDVFSNTTPPLEENYHEVPWLTISIILIVSVAGIAVTRIIKHYTSQIKTGGKRS